MILIIDDVSFAGPSTMLEWLERLLFRMWQTRYLSHYMASYETSSQIDIGIIVNRQTRVIIFRVLEMQARGIPHFHVPFPHANVETAYEDNSYDSEELEHVD